jgi:hypothetical protein
MHIGMEKIVMEHLRKKYFHAAFRQPFHVRFLRMEFVDISDWNSINALHHHDIVARVLPENFRHI